MSVSDKEAVILTAAERANPWWFRAMVKAAEVQAERRAKYSGEDADPFLNFKIVGYLMRLRFPGMTDTDVFYLYQCLKFARLAVNAGDAPDESHMDTLIDMGNYSFLEAGYRDKMDRGGESMGG